MVVAYTSFWLGQVTRPISLRTSDRKRRARPHQPVTLSRARPLKVSSLLSTIAIAAALLRQHWQDRRESNPQPPVLETGALPIELLSFFNRGASPLGLPYTLTRSPLRRLAPFAWFASLCSLHSGRFASLASFAWVASLCSLHSGRFALLAPLRALRFARSTPGASLCSLHSGRFALPARVLGATSLPCATCACG